MFEPSANASSEAPSPRLSPALGLQLNTEPRVEDATAAAQLLAGTYWNDVFDVQRIAAAHVGSSAWVVAYDARGRLVATARAISDGAKHAWVYDVFVVEELRGTGVGATLMRALLEHPRVRGCAMVHLGTRDAQRFYEQLGFVDRSKIPRPYTSTTMTLARISLDPATRTDQSLPSDASGHCAQRP